MSAAVDAPARAWPSAATISGARLADRDDRRLARRQRPARSRKSPPLNRPPRIDDQPVAEALDRAPRRLDVGRLRVVHEPHAADLGHRLERVLEAGESLDRARSSPPASTPASCATAAAASTSASRWRPSSRIDVSGTSGSELPSRRADDRVARRARCRRRAARSSRTAAAVHARRARCASDAGSSALSTAQSAAVWFAKIRAFAAAYSSTVAWRSRWSGEKFRSTAIHGWNVSIAFELEAARLDDVNRLGGRGLDLRAQRVADVAADQDLWPPASSIRPVSVVVVDLPLVPVIATIRPRSQRDASSSSPITWTPRAARRFDRRLIRAARRGSARSGRRP